MALVALVGCSKIENDPVSEKQEMNFTALNSVVTRGYAEGASFLDTYTPALHFTDADKAKGNQKWRTMQISAYLYPQNGEEGNYFVDKTYAHSGDATTWWNVNPTSFVHDPIYWPVGGTLDFLAYSLSVEENSVKNVDVVWNDANAASEVTLDVPGENSQNDILFASAYGVKSTSGAQPVPMTFNHAQAWIEFVMTGTPKDVIKLNRIELEDVYNAGVVTFKNNKGNATATWDFSAESKKNIEVDNEYGVKALDPTTPGYLDMLIPQQKKTAFVIYYTLGTDTQELSYRFTTDQKTWLMGEKYVYNIHMTTNEITVKPEVTVWKAGDVADINGNIQ